MTAAEKELQEKIDTFRLLFGAVTIPFGAMLGGMLNSAVSRNYVVSVKSADLSSLAIIFFGSILMFAFFAIVPTVCEGILRGHMPSSKMLKPVIILVVLGIAVYIPFVVPDIQPAIWIAVVTAWLACCAFIVWLCKKPKRGVEP